MIYLQEIQLQSSIDLYRLLTIAVKLKMKTSNFGS